MKWKKIKRMDSFTIAPKEGVYARPHAKAVRRRKKERRYVKDGSGRCQVFLVSIEKSVLHGSTASIWALEVTIGLTFLGRGLASR